MDCSGVKQNSFKAWLLAARPQTLTAAAVPVMIGASMAWGMGDHSVAFWFCLAFALIMQIDANLVNDYFDFKRGNDSVDRLGPPRACTEGWITPDAMKMGIAVTTALACLVGLPLIWFGGLWVVAVGVFCVLFCFLYTTHLSYWGLGDLLVIVFFGLVPVVMTFYLVSEVKFDFRYIWDVVAHGFTCGLVIDLLLIVNNLRDYDNDILAGKRTLAVFLGKDMTMWLYFMIPVVVMLINLLTGFHMDNDALFYTGLLFLFVSSWGMNKVLNMRYGEYRNNALPVTAFIILIYGVLTSLALVYRKDPFLDFWGSI